MTEKILIVEDEQNLRQLYQMELEAEGYEVLTAKDGDDALDEITHEPIDLVVLDLEVPGEHGLELLEHLVELNRQTKVVINTGYPTYKWNFHSWAADAFLTKSSDLSDLKKTIDQVLHTELN